MVGHSAGGPRVIVTRPAAQAGGLLAALRARDLRPLLVPAIEISAAQPGELQDLRRAVANADWVAVTSANGADAALRAVRELGIDAGSLRWAAVGPATAQVLARAGIRDVWRPSTSRGSALAAELPIEPGQRVVLARAAVADPEVVATLRRRGALVADLVAYRTVDAPEGSRASLRAALAHGQPAAVLLMSGSAVRGLLALAAPDLVERCRALPAVCIGSVTAEEARTHGFDVIGTSDLQDAAAGGGPGGRPAGARPEHDAGDHHPPSTGSRRAPGRHHGIGRRTGRRAGRRARGALRRTPALRSLVRETRLHPSMLVAPLFVRPGSGVREPISSLRRPGAGCRPTRRSRRRSGSPELGVGGMILFGLPDAKDADGSGAWIEEGIVQQTLRSLRDRDLPLVLIADTCLCEYTDARTLRPAHGRWTRRQRSPPSSCSRRPRSRRSGRAPTWWPRAR